jgi:SseB protein N-terminal domain
MRSIPDPGFAGDDGEVRPEVAAALAAYAGDPAGRHQATLAVVQDTRLLVPVVAVLGEVEHDEQGLAHDKTSDMATVLMRGKDGRLALLAFSGNEPMRRWQPDARPVPVSAAQAAQAAVHDGADALVLDVAGPTLLVVEGEDLRSLAEGFRMVRTPTGWAWAKLSEGGPDAPDR